MRPKWVLYEIPQISKWGIFNKNTAVTVRMIFLNLIFV